MHICMVSLPPPPHVFGSSQHSPPLHSLTYSPKFIHTPFLPPKSAMIPLYYPYMAGIPQMLDPAIYTAQMLQADALMGGGMLAHMQAQAQGIPPLAHLANMAEHLQQAQLVNAVTPMPASAPPPPAPADDNAEQAEGMFYTQGEKHGHLDSQISSPPPAQTSDATARDSVSVERRTFQRSSRLSPPPFEVVVCEGELSWIVLDVFCWIFQRKKYIGVMQYLLS